MSLKDLIADVNVNEICEHIETETLSEWVNAWQEAALSMLQAENEKLQKMYQEEKVVCHEIQLELERMKKIMRENGIMVIPSEYPGSTEKWNIQKPRDKKEEL